MQPPSLLVLAAASLLLVPSAADTAGTVRYVFDPDYAGGVSGTITAEWESVACDRVTVKTDLNFKRVDLAALAKADGNCTGKVTEYKWHIHTLWNQPTNAASGSASFAGCAKAITGNHYDPWTACGPASEYADSPACKPKITDYACTPARYAQDATFCEAGDLSGKFGGLKPNKEGLVKAQWVDSVYPRWGDHKPTWNIVLHAVCGAATPRVACAVGYQSEATNLRHQAKAVDAKAVVVKQPGQESDPDQDEDDGDDGDDGEERASKLLVKIRVHKKHD